MSTRSIDWFLRHVKGQLGAHENPLGSNRTVYGEQFGWNGVSWCSEFAWDMYTDAGVVLPAKTAACVVIYDAAVKARLRYDSTNCVPGDSVIRTWERKSRGTLNPAETHYQIVVEIQHRADGKWLGLIGGNQGDGYVGPAVEWVHAGDSSILGGLAFHGLFDRPQGKAPKADKRRDTPHLPKKKSHPHPLSDTTTGQVERVTRKLDERKRPVNKAGRKRLRRLAAAIKHFFGGKS